MRLQTYLKALYWILPLSLYATDANAWGLYTHVYFAQSLLMATPLLDHRFREIIKHFPELVMAGACLPDLAVISKKFKTTHQWQKAEYLMSHAQTDEETAVALGYMSHLYVDVIAHHHFVPAHEALWHNESIYTHIASEWAMDTHIQPQLSATPGQLLTKHAHMISHFLAPCFNQPQQLVKNNLIKLAYADRLLRLVKLPSLIHACIRFNNREKHQQFNYYLNTTLEAMNEFHKALAGYRPSWEPELPDTENIDSRIKWRRRCLQELNINREMPIQYFTH